MIKRFAGLIKPIPPDENAAPIIMLTLRLISPFL
jgi:hypothetical protein